MNAPMEVECAEKALCDVEIEQALLGAILADNQALERAGSIRPEHFFDSLHQRIFDKMLSAAARGITIEPLTINAEMTGDPGMAEVGGLAYFAVMLGACPALPKVESYATILIDYATRRNAHAIAAEVMAGTITPAMAATAFDELAQHFTHEEVLPIIDVAGWDDLPVPPMDWQTPSRIPRGCVTLFSGNGGVGKTTMTLDLAVATITGQDWLGVRPTTGPVILIFCEDSRDEFHRRLSKVLARRGLRFIDIRADLYPISLVGRDTFLATFSRDGLIRPTPLYKHVAKLVAKVRPSLLVLDNSANLFGGNENDRVQVGQFGTLLNRAALAGNCGLVLTSHPSLSGMNNGSGTSGSTGWHNVARARMYLREPDGEDHDPDERTLEVMKSNYGPPGETINLRWQNGVFVPTEGTNAIDRGAAADTAAELFMELLGKLAQQGRNASHMPTSPNYAPTIFAREPEAKAKGVKKAAFATAMSQLFDQSKIHVETYGRPSQPTRCLGIGPKP